MFPAFDDRKFAPLLTAEQAVTYLVVFQVPALQRLAREHFTADALRKLAADHPHVRFNEAPEPSAVEVACGKPDIWVYAARVVLRLQDSVGRAELALFDHHTLVLAGYLNDIPAHAVASQLDWFID